MPGTSTPSGLARLRQADLLPKPVDPEFCISCQATVGIRVKSCLLRAGELLEHVLEILVDAD